LAFKRRNFEGAQLYLCHNRATVAFVIARELQLSMDLLFIPDFKHLLCSITNAP